MKPFLLFFTIILSCSSKEPQIATNSVALPKVSGKQINLTILLDLSDRIDPVKNPSNPQHYQRDSILVNYLVKYFVSQIQLKGAYAAKGKMRILFSPNPNIPDINQAAANLNIDLSKMKPQEKKLVYETLEQTVTQNVNRIYKAALHDRMWAGSDLWRFFKNDVKDMAVSPDTSYRNVLVILTDGYIYHVDSKIKSENRYSYLLPALLDQYNLRKIAKWEAVLDKLDFGLITTRNDLDQLEVLVLEVQPSSKNKNDEDIIGKVMHKWLNEMRVKKEKVYGSNIPEFTRQQIERFLLQ